MEQHPGLRRTGRAIPRLPQVVVVGAGKGGVGTSSAAVLLALGAEGTGLRVLLVDLDEGGSVLPAMLGLGGLAPLDGRPGTEHEALAERVVPLARGLSFLPLGLETGEEIAVPTLRRIRLQRAARIYEAFDLVIVDGGSRLASVAAALAPGAGRMVAVTTSDRISMAATHALLKATHLMAPGLPLEVIVNRSDAGTAGGVAGLVQEAAGTFLGREVELAAVLPDDPNVSGAVASLPFLPPGSPARAAAAVPIRRWAAGRDLHRTG